MTILIIASGFLLGIAVLAVGRDLEQAIKRLDALEKRISDLERIVWRLE